MKNIRVGYASSIVGLPYSGFKSLRLKNLEEEAFYEIVEKNLDSLERIIDYNISRSIDVFRISSDLIPLASHRDCNFNWQDSFKDRWETIGTKLARNKIRISMHPGQYTVLNSKDPDVVRSAIRDLSYHRQVLDLLGTDSSSKIVIHIGGVYGNKSEAIERFKKNYRNLDPAIKSRLVIENDDKSYGFMEAWKLAMEEGIPLIYDNLHDAINKDNKNSPRENIILASKTFKDRDGRQKIHYSQNGLGRLGSHSQTINLEKFSDFYSNIKDLNLDIMLEVKDKNLSAVKVKNFIEGDSIKLLEEEWARYKYSVLEHSPKLYQELREFLKDKNNYRPVEFYGLIDRALAQEVTMGRSVNALEHVVGYFKDMDPGERKKYETYLDRYKKGSYSIWPLKKYIYSLAEKYEEDYLLKSLYFHI